MYGRRRLPTEYCSTNGRRFLYPKYPAIRLLWHVRLYVLVLSTSIKLLPCQFFGILLFYSPSCNVNAIALGYYPKYTFSSIYFCITNTLKGLFNLARLSLWLKQAAILSHLIKNAGYAGFSCQNNLYLLLYFRKRI